MYIRRPRLRKGERVREKEFVTQQFVIQQEHIRFDWTIGVLVGLAASLFYRIQKLR